MTLGESYSSIDNMSLDKSINKLKKKEIISQQSTTSFVGGMSNIRHTPATAQGLEQSMLENNVDLCRLMESSKQIQSILSLGSCEFSSVVNYGNLNSDDSKEFNLSQKLVSCYEKPIFKSTIDLIVKEGVDKTCLYTNMLIACSNLIVEHNFTVENVDTYFIIHCLIERCDSIDEVERLKLVLDKLIKKDGINDDIKKTLKVALSLCNTTISNINAFRTVQPSLFNLFNIHPVSLLVKTAFVYTIFLGYYFGLMYCSSVGFCIQVAVFAALCTGLTIFDYIKKLSLIKAGRESIIVAMENAFRDIYRNAQDQNKLCPNSTIAAFSLLTLFIVSEKIYGKLPVASLNTNEQVAYNKIKKYVSDTLGIDINDGSFKSQNLARVVLFISQMSTDVIVEHMTARLGTKPKKDKKA